MAVNKVIFGTDVQIDLTEDTVTADKLLEGVTAHAANGEQITGTLVMQNDIYLTGTLNAGDTTITFTHESLTSDSCIDIYTDKSELGWISRSVVGTTLTIIFPPQTTNTSIKIKVSGGV